MLFHKIKKKKIYKFLHITINLTRFRMPSFLLYQITKYCKQNKLKILSYKFNYKKAFGGCRLSKKRRK